MAGGPDRLRGTVSAGIAEHAECCRRVRAGAGGTRRLDPRPLRAARVSPGGARDRAGIDAGIGRRLAAERRHRSIDRRRHGAGRGLQCVAARTACDCRRRRGEGGPRRPRRPHCVSGRPVARRICRSAARSYDRRGDRSDRGAWLVRKGAHGRSKRRCVSLVRGSVELSRQHGPCGRALQGDCRSASSAARRVSTDLCGRCGVRDHARISERPAGDGGVTRRMAGRRGRAPAGVADPAALSFAGGGVGWRDAFFDAEALGATRQHHLVSVGSCSFREPVDEIQTVAVQAS